MSADGETPGAPGEAAAVGGAPLIRGLIAASARHRAAVLCCVAGLSAWGWYALRQAPLDAIPDLSDTQVIVFTDWPGHSADQVENQITYPVSAALLGAPRVRVVRGQSMFGMSFVYAIFDDGTDLYWARSRLLEYLNQVQGTLPAGVRPRLGPDATAVGWVLEYALIDTGGGHDLQQLRALQDWQLRYALESVHGVAEVAAVGGFVKQYQVEVDPRKLRAYGIPLAEVLQAVRQANAEVGGSAIELAGHEVVIRGRGYVRAPDDLASLPLAPQGLVPGRAPITLRDVAAVTLGPAERRGLAELGGRGEAVGGIVVMRYGENALATLHAIKRRLAEIAATLPSGVRLVITYDRSQLIEEAISTLRRTLFEELAVVSLVIFLFLLHARSALVPIVSLPIGVLLSFIPMFYQGLTINLMSLGGIAVALGAMADATIVLIENVHKRLEAWEAAGRPGGPAGRAARLVAAMQEVGPSLFFSLLVITAAFLPVFTLQGTEGRLFAPLAFTKTYAMAFSALLAVTLTPALAALLVRGTLRREAANPLNRWLIRAYAPVVRFVVDHRGGVAAAAVVLLAVSLPAYLRLGQEFMPPLNEGVILYMPTAPPGMSMATASRILQVMDRRLAAFPEVATVFGKMGRAETPTDPAPIGMVETVVTLKPRRQWRPGLTWDGLIRELDAQLRYPGMPNVWWMPIQTRTEMLATGLRSPLGVKVLGDDLAAIERTAIAIEHAVAAVPGTRSAFAERAEGGIYLDLEVDREAASRYGLRVADVYDVVAAAVGGETVSQTLEGRQRYPIVVRYAREFRDDPQALLSAVLLPAPAGAPGGGIPLSAVARVHFTAGPPMLRSEEGKLVGYVFLDVAGRPLADYVADARRAVAARLTLPPGIRVEWTGQYESYERARQRLARVVPLTLLLIVVLLYFGTGSAVETGIVLLAVPFSLVGAVWLLYLLGYNVSVAVWVGLIALAGLDAETGVVMLLYLKLAYRRRLAEGRLASFADLREAIVEGAAQRIRPKLMTVLTMTAGLLPILWSSGTGADLMRRIAAPMVGGLATSFLLELLVYPALFAIWRSRGLRLSRPESDNGTLV
ncbi:MAG TPA: CusA/CzcA family heavy metal efflux RND transporter [Thermoanaerobaculia bacterium]|nr:CusA/CzcA family heavy metal efflux RND transporter [Thermoanaerobaculia bacterium]